MRYAAHGRTGQGIVSVDVDEARYVEIREAKATCLFALELEEKLALVMDDYAEYEMELLRLAEWSLIWPDRVIPDSTQERLTLDRRLANLLAACRLYLDQTDHLLSRIFGKSSPELSAIKAFKNELHSKHWGYRLMEAVRDHVQHSRMAIYDVGYRTSQSDDHTYVEFTVAPRASVKEFAENAKFDRKVLAELKDGEERVNLKAPVRDYVSCLITIHKRMQETTGQRVSDARKTYETAVDEFSKLDGDSVKFPELVEIGDDDTIREEVWLVTDFLSRSDVLQKRNAVNENLQHSAASNRDRS